MFLPFFWPTTRMGFNMYKPSIPVFVFADQLLFSAPYFVPSLLRPLQTPPSVCRITRILPPTSFLVWQLSPFWAAVWQTTPFLICMLLGARPEDFRPLDLVWVNLICPPPRWGTPGGLRDSEGCIGAAGGEGGGVVGVVFPLFPGHDRPDRPQANKKARARGTRARSRLTKARCASKRRAKSDSYDRPSDSIRNGSK